MSFAAKKEELEDVVLSEKDQTQKGKDGLSSLVEIEKTLT